MTLSEKEIKREFIKPFKPFRMSTTNQEQTSEILVTGKVDIDYPTKSNIMTVSKEAFTSKNELIKNRRENPSIEDRYMWLDLSNAGDEILAKVSHWPFLYQKNLPEISITDLFKEAGVTVQEGYNLCQLFKLCDHKEKWSVEMIQNGIIFLREYEGYDPAWNLKINYNGTQVSSHGHEFFLEFFKITKGWFDEEETLNTPDN